ncbi:hypothetical protein [Sinorhizobium sp. BJ1]|uniref:hypothetical protein n=1 Tax=Sinorhizobium sp. BJ1 TaxID=2035455 RepID=UPI000BEACE37|nr:hypothetical protein [Sinorhizobium sp. BJ1]PDT86526.1 hypothetical protein CO676_02225 [Sinorhizobium sp. BJ1]
MSAREGDEDPTTGKPHFEPVLNGPELWEIVYGALEGDVPEEFTDEVSQRIADAINEAFPRAEYLLDPANIYADRPDPIPNSVHLHYARTIAKLQARISDLSAALDKPEAGEAETRPKLGHMPKYGLADFNDLVRAVALALFDRDDIDFELDANRFMGHQMVPAINFNSLNRIVSAFSAAPVQEPTPGMIEAAWQAYQDCPIDLCGDHDEELKKSVVAALRAALSSSPLSAGDAGEIERLRKALQCADEWMSCVEGHLRDGQTFKRDREMIRAALTQEPTNE